MTSFRVLWLDKAAVSCYAESIYWMTEPNYGPGKWLMSYLGIVRNGKVELPPGTQLPEGATVRVEVSDESDPLDLWEELAVDGGPPDLASRHDWYIYGVSDDE